MSDDARGPSARCTQGGERTSCQKLEGARGKALSCRPEVTSQILDPSTVLAGRGLNALRVMLSVGEKHEGRTAQEQAISFALGNDVEVWKLARKVGHHQKTAVSHLAKRGSVRKTFILDRPGEMNHHDGPLHRNMIALERRRISEGTRSLCRPSRLAIL